MVLNVLLEWAPALMGVSPSGCLHGFFVRINSALQLSPRAQRRDQYDSFYLVTRSQVDQATIAKAVFISANFSFVARELSFGLLPGMTAIPFSFSLTEHCRYFAAV